MNIGFTGYNMKQTYENFRSFVWYNRDIIEKFNIAQGYAKLKDGDEIFIIFRTNKACMERRYNYLIVSDDSRMMARRQLPILRWADDDGIPWEFKIIEDNIDIYGGTNELS